ncbi:olfactory receptor 8B8-like [Gastrophryne carolinensis]
MNIGLANRTIVSDFLLLGLSDLPSLQLPLFLFFLLIYLLTLTWNLMIIILIVTDSHLRTPMYFFLGNLASLDLCTSSVTVPRMLSDFHTKRKMIELSTCLTQFFFFLFFVVSEAFLLTIMSYDRYIAICCPLHYLHLMNRKMCISLVLTVWLVGLAHSLVHTLYALKLKFCVPNIINSFFCDLPQLLQISCSDHYINSLLIFLLADLLAGIFGIMTFLSYAFIVKTVLRMKVTSSRWKVFSTCSSHLIVVSVFYIAGSFNYFQPSSNNHGIGDKVASVFYATLTPFLNPLIYSLRNREIKTAFRHVLICG